MTQEKIFGLADYLKNNKEQISDIIHDCIVEKLKFPREKKCHRFFELNASNYIMPTDKTEKYIIIEILMMTGRERETKKDLIKFLFHRFTSDMKLSPGDIEICILESDPANWGFRGMTGDEIKLNYNIKV